MNTELRTILTNLETAYRNKDWGIVDRATSRLANYIWEERNVEHR